jgi:pimeloyl-ACP methyl ester carboxylesterase
VLFYTAMQSQALTLSFLRGALGILSRTSPDIASYVAADLFMKPRRHAQPPREREALADAVPFRVHSLQAWRWGTSGPPVLLVHGWEGRGAQLGSFVRPLLAAGFSVVTFDAFGHGASGGNRSSLPHFAWGVRCLAEAIEGPHAVIAHSFGCAATTLAMRDGLITQRVVFVAPPIDPSDYVARFGNILGLGDDVLDRMKHRMEQRFFRKWSDYSLVRIAETMSRPLLIVHDRDDDETHWSGGAELAEAWPGAELLTTTGLGHRRILRDSSVVEAVTRFVLG